MRTPFPQILTRRFFSASPKVAAPFPIRGKPVAHPNVPKPKPAKKCAMETLKGKPLDRAELDNLMRRTLFYTPSFEIYGGVSGFYDYGPPGTALNANIMNLWRRHFVLEENMLELEYECLGPYGTGRGLIG
jgi:glycyl-tRNA synthetase